MDLGLSQAQVAKLADVSQTTVSAWECGQSSPRHATIVRLAAKLGVPFDSIVSPVSGYATQTRTRFRARAQSSPYGSHLPSGATIASEMVEAPIVGTISAGPLSESGRVEGFFTIPPTLRMRYPKAFFVRVEGTSMNRTLPNGCLALVDPTQTQIDEHGAFAFMTENYEFAIKRVKILPNGFELRPDSYDPIHRPLAFEGTQEENPNLMVVGRVIWMTTPLDYEV